jgi:superfamily I DNA/RNA helicase/RecB family exonuclease
MLERLKQELVPFERLHAWADKAEDREKAGLMQACVRLFRAYEEACRKDRLLDFEDLLTLTVRMLSERPALLDTHRRRYPHVLVDEYQDLNLAQERLVELIAGAAQPFVVGDDDQSIYRFRGASRASLERFLRAFPEAQTVTLGRNHRSSRRIVAAASALIANNGERLPKLLRSSRSGEKVELWSCPDGVTEAEAIASEASRLLESGFAAGEIAVLCRTNAIARPIAEALSVHGLPHVVSGGHGFYDRPEIKDAIALLRVLRDPNDVVALARALTRPPLCLDADPALSMLRDRKELPPLEALMKWKPAAGFAGLLAKLHTQSAVLDVRDLFFELMQGTRYLDSASAQAVANVSRFAELIADFCETSVDRSLEAYMRRLDLVLLSQEDERPADVEGVGDAIQVMTIHQAKGLEFEAVFVPGLVEGRLPQSGRSPRFELPAAVLEPLVRGKADVIAEERRLLYVAMTRARRLLYLTRASHYEGGRRWRDSRFLDEVKAAGGRTIVLKNVAGIAKPPPLTLPTSGEGVPAVVLSFSSIATYLDCPRQYWYRHVQRLPAVQTAEAVQGDVLHETLRRAAEARRTGTEITAGMLHATHQQVWNETAFPDARRAATFERNGASQLEAYRKQGGLIAQPEYLEQPFTTAVDGWTLNGIIDRIDRTAEGWRIIDYKSGRPVTRGRRDLQVALYALGAASALKLDPIELEMVYLASGESVLVDHTRPLLAEATKQGTDVAEGVRSGRFDARPDRRRCRLCPYRLVCAEAL